MCVKSINKLKKVARSELCNRCGSCVGLSEGKIVFKDKTGKYRPSIFGELDDQTAHRLWQACSGKEFNFPGYREKIYGRDINFHTYIGAYKNIYTGFARDPVVRQHAASGGIISAVLVYLLEKRRIDGAVTLIMSKEEPWMNQPVIATTKEEILEAAQSKYTISSVNEILPEIEKFNGKLAYVGLPGQVQSIRKLQAVKDPAVKNIKYIFGPFYGNTLHFSSVISFLKTHKERNYRDIQKLYFRYGEWPGNMRVEMKSGRVLELKKFHANYLIPFHILGNSLYCTDMSNEYTDISGGDAWAQVYEERGKGFSLVISRSGQGQRILNEMVKEGIIELDRISESEAITMHSHGYDFKKRGAFIRIKMRKWLGKQVPDYGYTLKGFPFSRWLVEFIISILFIILGTRPARWAVERFSPGFIGKLFEKSRTKWKKSTYKLKRKKLN